MTVAFDAGEVVLDVRGEFGLLTCPPLGALLLAVADQSHPRVVVDLSDVEFTDSQGPALIAEIAQRVVASGGELVIRSPSTTVLRGLEATELGPSVRIETSGAGVVTLGPEQQSGDHSSSVEPGRVSSDLVRAVTIPANEGVVDAALRLVVELARETVGGADGVSASLQRRRRLTTVAASNETIAQMDRDQYATGQGPCVAAAAEGRWFHVESLAEETRWPDFIPRAMAGGISSILSTPLLAATGPVGALNIYSSAERAFGPRQQELAALFATQASAILTDAGVDVPADQVDARLRNALRSREVIAQAIGALMARDGVTADEAHSLLRRSSRRSELTLRASADALLASMRPEIAPNS